MTSAYGTCVDEVLGKNIRARRERQKKSRAELATHLGVDVSIVCRIEGGKVAVSVGRLYEIAVFLETTAARLLPRPSTLRAAA